MSFLTWLVLLIGGIILRANPTVFNGAHTVGQIMVVAAIVWGIFSLVLIILAAIVGSGR